MPLSWVSDQVEKTLFHQQQSVEAVLCMSQTKTPESVKIPFPTVGKKNG